jgi:hypothetical protein
VRRDSTVPPQNRPDLPPQSLLDEWRNELARQPLSMAEGEACRVMGLEPRDGGALDEEELKAAYRRRAGRPRRAGGGREARSCSCGWRARRYRLGPACATRATATAPVLVLASNPQAGTPLPPGPQSPGRGCLPGGAARLRAPEGGCDGRPGTSAMAHPAAPQGESLSGFGQHSRPCWTVALLAQCAARDLSFSTGQQDRSCYGPHRPSASCSGATPRCCGPSSTLAIRSCWPRWP